MEKEIAKDLINKFIRCQNRLEYVNLDTENKYLGWVYDFNIVFQDNNISLNLNEENDKFLLFVLALAWSRSGPWENAAFLVTYLKLNNKDTHEYWLKKEHINYEINKRDKNAAKIRKEVSGTVSRKKITFRKDIFKSIHILATKWDEIKAELESSNNSGDYVSFMKYMREIKGLSVGTNRIYIKIPLILRELRCQNIYENIPGELCCVPDKRVEESSKKLGIKLPVLQRTKEKDIESLIKVSSKIYTLFGDLYDLPLFAYEDLLND